MEEKKDRKENADGCTVSEDPLLSGAKIGETEAVAPRGFRAKVERRFPLAAVIFVLLMSVLFLTVGSAVQQANVQMGLLFTEFGLILGGSFLYVRITGQSFRRFFRIYPAKFSVFVKVFFISFFMIPIGVFLNLITVVLIRLFGIYTAPDLPLPTEAGEILGSLFVVAVSAGICEEFMFRGAILSSFERGLGRRKSAFLAALFFGLFHFNLGNLLSPIALGLLFAYLTQITGSIFPAVFGHFMNNALAVLMSFFASKLEGAESVGGDVAFPTDIGALQIGVAVGIFVLVVLFCVFVVAAFLRSVKKSYPKKMSDLYGIEVEEKYDYPVTDYVLWGKQPGSPGLLAQMGILVYLVVYAVISYLIFFAG